MVCTISLQTSFLGVFWTLVRVKVDSRIRRDSTMVSSEDADLPDSFRGALSAGVSFGVDPFGRRFRKANIDQSILTKKYRVSISQVIDKGFDSKADEGGGEIMWADYVCGGRFKARSNCFAIIRIVNSIVKFKICYEMDILNA